MAENPKIHLARGYPLKKRGTLEHTTIYIILLLLLFNKNNNLQRSQLKNSCSTPLEHAGTNGTFLEQAQTLFNSTPSWNVI